MGAVLCGIAGAVGMTIGLYAGRGRAEGKDWSGIAEEAWKDTCEAVEGAWNSFSSLFSKGNPKSCDEHENGNVPEKEDDVSKDA